MEEIKIDAVTENKAGFNQGDKGSSRMRSYHVEWGWLVGREV